MVPLYVVCDSHGFSIVIYVQCIGTWCMTCFIFFNAFLFVLFFTITVMTTCIITVGSQPITDYFAHVTGQFCMCSDIMAAQRSSSSSDSCLSAPRAKKNKRQVSIVTFKRWKSQFDYEHQSLLWLCCEKDPSDRTIVSTLFCQVC